MRVFSINRRFVNGVEQFENLNCNLTSSDVLTIVSALGKFKTDDVVLSSCVTNILSTFKPLL